MPRPHPVVSGFVKLAREHRLNYGQFNEHAKIARKLLNLRPEKKRRHLPHLLTAENIKKFYKVIDEADDLQHQIMLRLLFFTAIRVSELVNVRVEDVDIAGSKIFIKEGKGDKDRVVPFPDPFRLALKSHMRATPHNRYLFESQYKTKFSPRRVQQLVKEYAEMAEMPVKVHPHLFRHQMITLLTDKGMTDAEIQLVSGHASKKSLEVYQHVGLKGAMDKYQEIVKELGI